MEIPVFHTLIRHYFVFNGKWKEGAQPPARLSAFRAQPSDWAQPHRYPNSKSASSPFMDRHAPTMVNIQRGLTINWPFCNYTKEIATLILFSIQKGGIAVFASIKGKIAFSTATTSSEFKRRIQPIMDGHAPTMVNIWYGSIALFHMSPWNEPTKYNWARGAAPRERIQAIAYSGHWGRLARSGHARI